MTLEERAYRALNRITKWRSFFAGWQLGTRSATDPECNAVKDHREVTISLRVESSALVGLLVSKGVMTREEWLQAVLDEANLLEHDYEERFPGAQATDIGMEYDSRIATTMKDWHP